MKSRLRPILHAVGVGVLLAVVSAAPPRIGGAADDGASASPRAAAALAETRDDPHEVETLRILSRAEGLLRLGHVDAAVHAVASLPRNGPHAGAALRVRSWALLAARRHAELDGLLEDRDDVSDQELLYLRGAARRRDRRYNEALDDLRTLWWGHPDGVWGLASLRELAEGSHSPYGPDARALIRRHVPAASVDTRLTAHWEIGAILDALRREAQRHGLLTAELRHAIGVRLLRAEEFTSAVTQLRSARARTTDIALRRVIELHLGEAERRRGAYAAAQEHFANVAEGGRDPFGEKALALAGQMAIEYRRYDDARRHFEAQLVTNPVGSARHQALWGLGWVAFRTGNFRDARRFLASLGTEAPYGPLAPRAVYWGARALEELGDRVGAGLEMAALKQRFPVDYYAYRADRWAGGQEPLAQIAALPSSPPNQRVAHIEGLIEAEMRRRAREALRSLRGWTDSLGPHDLDRLHAAARKAGDARSAEAFRVARYRRFPTDPAAVAHLAARFPGGMVALLGKHARRQRLDPSLPIAVALQESGFDPGAASPTGALGLMQLMPATARGLYKEEARRHLATTAEILDPENNVRIGVRYLGRMIRAFDGRVEYALAAYNAGPGAVTRWREARGDLPVEIFVEEIPYDETRDYVRQVLAGLQVYRFVEAARKPREPAAALAQRGGAKDGAPK